MSDEGWQLLEQLHHRFPARSDPIGDRQRLARLGQLRDLTVLPAVLPLALDPDLSQEVVDTVASLLDKRRASEVCGLDRLLRTPLGVGGQILVDWENLSLDRLQRLADLPSGHWLVAAVCSHRNGRLRQWAVQRLAESLQSGQEIAYLVARLNDWVQPVRQVAAATLESRLTESSGAYLVECLPFLDRIPGRPDQRDLLERIRAFISRPALLESGLASPDRWLRRSAFRASELGEEVLRRGLQDSDQFIQTWASRQVAKIPLTPAFLEELLNHRRPAARLAGISASPGLDRLELLLDESPRVRAAAQSRFAHQDLAEFYRQHLALGELRGLALALALKAALAGLGETGQAEDAALLLPFCGHSRVALRALARLDRDGHLEYLLELLASPQPGLARESFRALISAAGRLTRPLCQLAVDELAPTHSRVLALDLLERGDKWESFALLVKMRQTEGVGALLERWWQHYNRRQILPTVPQLQRAREALAGVSSTEWPELKALLSSLPTRA